MRRFVLTSGSVLISAMAGVACAQSTLGGVNGWKGLNELQPLRVQRSLLGDSLLNCPVTDRAGVQKDLEESAERADLVEKALGLTVVFLTGDEGGKAEQELIPALLSKAQTGAKLIGYWDKAQEWWYGRSDATRFQVCRPGPGVMVVRPVKFAFHNNTPFQPAAGLAGSLAKQPMPVLTAPLSQPVRLGSTYFHIPDCTRITGLSMALANRPSVMGRAAKLKSLSGGMVPVSGTVVTLFGPSSASCQTAMDGTFMFDGLVPGTYTLMVGLSTTQRLTIVPGANLQLGDLMP